MSEGIQCLAWLQKHAVDENVSAVAYEAVGPQARSVLKLCIARLHVLWGERPLAERSSRSFPQGFTVVRKTAPVPYALIFCRVDHAQAAHLLAASLPAILAGVPRVIPCFLSDTPETLPEDGLLAALELAGLEQAVCVSEAEALGACALFHKDFGVGRVVILGDAAFGGAFALAAHRLGIPLALCRDMPGGALELDAVHAGVWVWPDLGPDWFRTSQLRLHEAEETADAG